MLRESPDVYALGGIFGDARKQAAEAYLKYVEDASADARSKDPKCITSVVKICPLAYSLDRIIPSTPLFKGHALEYFLNFLAQ